MTETTEQAPRSLDEIYDDVARAEMRLAQADEAFRAAEQEQSAALQAVHILKAELRERNREDIQARMNGDG
jgi:hypothetical protein